MQSGYGVPETQQFMMDGCSSSSLLSISQNITNSSQAPPKQHMQYHHLHQQQQQQQQQRFLHIQHQHQHQIPITQPFFQQHQYPQFQTFLQQHERQLHQESGPDSSHTSRIVGGSGPSFIVTNLKFGVDDNSGLNDYNQVIQGKREDGRVEEPREEDSAIKEPFWKPLDIEYINRNNKRCKERMETPFEFCKKGEKGIEMEEGKSSGSNYGLFGELEAIYTAGGIGNGGNNQTGSGSALTGENPPATTAVLEPSGDRGGVDASETSTGEEASLKLQKSKRKKRRKQLGTIATFFERLVKQLMEQQENLHRRFLEEMENRDQERMIREEAWRQQETAKSYREEKARAEEHALASSREAAIVAFLEKITGETINLPTKAQFQNPSQFHEESQGDEKTIVATDLSNDNTNSNNVSMNNNNISRRWPKAEVLALIRVRSNLETKFQEPGLKGPLWEQVSSSMASMGYQRSAKRCKEKWENINKYFRKTKDSAKKRSQQSKTCPYFHQLDQLYSKSHTSSPHSSSSFAAAAAIVESKEHSELLDAIVVQPENGNSQNPPLESHQEPINMSRGFNFSEMGSLGLDFNRNGSGDDRRKEVGQDEEDDEEEEEEEEDDDGVEGDNEEHVRNLAVQREKGGDKHPLEHVVLFGLES